MLELAERSPCFKCPCSPLPQRGSLLSAVCSARPLLRSTPLPCPSEGHRSLSSDTAPPRAAAAAGAHSLLWWIMLFRLGWIEQVKLTPKYKTQCTQVLHGACAFPSPKNSAWGARLRHASSMVQTGTVISCGIPLACTGKPYGMQDGLNGYHKGPSLCSSVKTLLC